MDMISIHEITEAHNSVKMYAKLWFLSSAHRLIMVYFLPYFVKISAIVLVL